MMTSQTQLAIVLGFTALVLGIYTLACLRRDGWRRELGPATYLVICAWMAFGISRTLGHPMPAWMAMPQKDAEVISAQLIEGQAIYLWLTEPGAVEPRSFSLPWNEKQAAELYEAQEQAKTMRTGVKMRKLNSTGGLDEREPLFYAEPQPELPPKTQ